MAGKSTNNVSTIKRDAMQAAPAIDTVATPVAETPAAHTGVICWCITSDESLFYRETLVETIRRIVSTSSGQRRMCCIVFSNWYQAPTVDRTAESQFIESFVTSFRRHLVDRCTAATFT